MLEPAASCKARIILIAVHPILVHFQQIDNTKWHSFHTQGISESGVDVEYQVPTSSQRDQEDENVILLDSDEEDDSDDNNDNDDEDDDDEMADDGIAGVRFEDEEEEEEEVTDAYGMDEEPEYGDEEPDDDPESDGVSGRLAGVVGGVVGASDGADGAMVLLLPSDNNEVDVEDSRDGRPAQSQLANSDSGSSGIGVVGSGASTATVASAVASAAAAASDVGTSQTTTTTTNAGDGSSAAVVGVATAAAGFSATGDADRQQFQTISSGSATREAAAQQQQQQLALLRPFEDTDGIVPSTPTLYPHRGVRTLDAGGAGSGGGFAGFSEAVSSPQSQVPLSAQSSAAAAGGALAARFTFNEPAGSTSSLASSSLLLMRGVGPAATTAAGAAELENSVEFEVEMVMDDTHVELNVGGEVASGAELELMPVVAGVGIVVEADGEAIMAEAAAQPTAMGADGDRMVDASDADDAEVAAIDAVVAVAQDGGSAIAAVSSELAAQPSDNESECEWFKFFCLVFAIAGQ